MKKTILTLIGFASLSGFSQSWNTIFTSSGTGEKLQLVNGKKGEVYLGFRDFQKGKANVKKYENGNWAWVGDSAFSENIIANFKLEVAGDSLPVVAFQDTKKDYQLTVMKFNGTKWDTLGRRGFSGFTGAGEIGLACSGTKIFAAYQQYNQIKVWYWNSTNSTWDVVGSNGIASVGFPSGCDLKIIADKLYVGYRTNPGNNEVRNTDATNPSSSSVWYTVKSSFSSSMSGAIRISNVINMPMATNYNSTTKYFTNYIYGAGAWNSTGTPSDKVASFDICDGGSDTFPLLAYIDANNKGRIYRANVAWKWDSIGTSSMFTVDQPKGNPEVLWTGNKEIFVAYENNADWKIIVKKYCAPVNGTSVNLGGNDSFCSGGNASLSIKTAGVKVQWYRNNTILAGKTSSGLNVTQGGDYKAVVKNGCGDSFTTQATTITEMPSPQPTISQNGNTLTTQSFLAYQWKLNGVDIPTANSQSYNPTQSGNYTVSVLTAQLCTGTSVNFNYFPANTNQITNDKLMIYPNPMHNVFTLQTQTPIAFTISDISGKLVYADRITKNENISTNAWPAGVYFLRTENGSTQKLIKQ